MYRDSELIISPPFQRLFRWDSAQKSKLIESILLGIPLPSIFVAQDAEGRWELVDGLQRVSTLLQLQGLLDQDQYPPLSLEGTKYLPSLEGLVWESDTAPSLLPAQRLDIKRAKIDVKIIQRDSDPKTKYDLFQRLNSYGALLTNQELRNAQLVGINSEFASWLRSLADYSSFQEMISLSDNLLERRYDEELVLRFLYLHALNGEQIRTLRHFQDNLEEYAVNLALNFSSEKRKELEQTFTSTFDLLLHNDSSLLRRWDPAKNQYRGGFLNSAFEAIATSVGYYIGNDISFNQNLKYVTQEFWSHPSMQSRFATGKSTEERMRLMIPIGREALKLIGEDQDT